MLVLAQDKNLDSIVIWGQKHKVRPYKILIIQNITNFNQPMIDYHNSLGLLSFQAERQINDSYYRHGMQEIVILGKTLGFELDTYFLSFNYGLLQEASKFPTYDQYVDRKSFTHLANRAKQLNIPETLASLSYYDLIYLDIPENSLGLLDPTILQLKSPEVVYFTTNLYISPPFIGISLQDLKDRINPLLFRPKFFYANFKALLLANYLLMRRCVQQSTFLKFIQVTFEQSFYI